MNENLRIPSTTANSGGPPIEKKTGVAHLWAAATYSLGGARRLLGEAAFRHELIAFAVAMVAS